MPIFLINTIGTVLTKILVTAFSESMLKWTIFKVADAIVKSTKTPHDDEWLEQLKRNINRKKMRYSI